MATVQIRPDRSLDDQEQRVGELGVHELVSSRAKCEPQSLALVRGTEELSYDELEKRSNQLAHRLLREGLRPESLVAVLMERSPSMVIAQLAVLKAGGAYLSLDPSYPSERLSFMLKDSGAQWMLVQTAAPDLAENQRVLEIDALTATLANYPDDPPAVAVDGRQRAYVIYTSGSTGRPKGTELTHSGLRSLVAWHRAEYEVQPSDRASQVASPAFDASVWEIWPYITAGASLHFPSDEVRSSPIDLLDWLSAQEITLSFLPTPLAEALMALEMPAKLELRALLVGGDRLRRPPRDGLSFRLVNHYGPTEDTVVTTAGEIPPAVAGQRDGAPAIGLPISGEHVRLMGRNFEPVAEGVAGELTIGGCGLARGYLRRPAKTAESFVPDPSGGPGERLYRTGDLVARRSADGAFDFRGRIDHQVKVRGFRIELGEIEAALAAQSEVQEAVVAARPDASGALSLAAYVVPHQSPLTDLRPALSARLPEHMVPSVFVEMDALPLTPNGKLDRESLPEPVWGESTVERVAPRTGTERQLAELFADLLGLEEVGVHDRFFELGGHSLLAAQLVARVRETFDVRLAARQVFEQPTVEELAARVDELRAGGESQAIEAPPLPPIRRVPRDRPIPLSVPQRQVFFLDRLVPTSIAYNAQFTVSLDGALNMAALEAAFTEIVRRHEALRTTFVDVDGQPVQKIHPPWKVPVGFVDYSRLPEEEGQRLAEELTRTVVRRPFDVGCLPLAEWTLARYGENRHLLIQVEHHFIHDGWSVGALLRELMTLYEVAVEGKVSPLPPLPVQFADYASWQQEWMAGDGLAERLDFWKRELDGAPRVLNLPTDFPRPPEQTFRGRRLDTDLPADLYGRLRNASRREGVTLFMTMLSAFQVLLQRFSGETSFVTGSGVANRQLRDIEPLIGMIVNTIVMRADVSGEPTFRELLRRVRDMTLRVQAYQDLPFDRLVEALAPPRDLSRNPVFQYMFSFHDSPLPDVDFCGLEGRLLERHNGSTKSDWNVVFRPRAEQRVGREASDEDLVMRCMWEYSTELFETATIERIWGNYQVLLGAAIENPEAPISALPLLSAAERAQISSWNRTERELPSAVSVLELFERQVDADPGALVAAGESRLSYGELEDRANRLAHHLMGMGVVPEVLVGVCMQPGPELLVALLGVFKTGGAYLPLDPSHPRERLAFTLSDSGASVLLTEKRLLAEVPEAGVEQVVVVDGELPATPSTRPKTAARREHLAYVIYTSGSTGRPKGVELHHEGLLNLVSWHNASYDVKPGDRAAKTASLAFDASVWEIWPYLAAGASLHFPPSAVRAEPALFYRWLAEERIDITFVATPFAEVMLQDPPPADLRLRALLVGGDKLNKAPGPLPFRLVNHYGPTESTVVSTCGDVEGATQLSPHIGGPIDNLVVRILDGSSKPLPVGIPGELQVGGIGLARGYLNRPGLTAERFVPDPFASEPGARLYCTGDLVRYLASGNIEFVGRIDNQVKLRGFRIELGEIESVLAEYPGVRQAAVALREGTSGEPLLAAYFVDAGDNGHRDKMTRWLKRQLPHYMVPSCFVELESMPLSPNGKIDRQALPDPEIEPQTAEHIAPRTAVEEFLAETWEEVLDRESIGVLDNFFELGGHSLLAGRVLTRVREALDIEMPLKAIFEFPTLEALAAAVEDTLLAELDEGEA